MKLFPISQDVFGLSAESSRQLSRWLGEPIFSPSRDSACSRFLPDSWNISNQCQDSQEFFGRMHSSQQAEIFKSVKFTVGHMVTGQQFMIFNKPSP